MTTKDSAGTLSVNCYETKAGNPKPVDFARLAQTEEEISSDQSSSPEVLTFVKVTLFVWGRVASLKYSHHLSGQTQWEHVCCWEPRSDGYLLRTRSSNALSVVETLTTTAQLKTTSILSSVALDVSPSLERFAPDNEGLTPKRRRTIAINSEMHQMLSTKKQR